MATKREELRKMAKGEGALGKADELEPLFILRSTDKFAPNIIREWCMQVVRASHNSWINSLSHEDRRKIVDGDKDAPVPPSVPKVDEARKLAKEMERWQAKNQDRVKVPD